MQEFVFPVTIYYDHTDVNGFVYFTNYLKFIEHATTQLIADFGLKASDLIKMDALIAVRSLQCEYFRPAKLDDKIEVVSKILKFTEVTSTWHHIVRSQEDHQFIYCQATIERLCINKKLAPIRTPESLYTLIKQIA